jgi:hypothetical protein
MLKIDAEGLDYEVIKMIDFKTICPAIIHYECLHSPGRIVRHARRISWIEDIACMSMG